MDVVSRVNELLAGGQSFCLATVIESQNPQIKAGQKFIMCLEGVLETSFEIGLLNPQVLELARTTLKEKKCRLVSAADGMRIFIDVYKPETSLLICGAGHLAIPLSRFCLHLGFKVTILDDRKDFAHTSRFPGCTVIAEDFIPALRKIQMNSSTYVVVITRGHSHDVDCLQEILKKPTAYVGLIGSRRRVGFVLELLGKQGFSQDLLKQVFTPIGIPIGAESPEEIAISITAEIVCVLRKGFDQARALRSATGVFL